MKPIRRTVLGAISLCLAATLWAEDKTEVGGVYYTFDEDNKTATVVSPATGSYSGDIVIPEKVYDYYTVTTIGFSAFRSSSITSVKLPETLTTIMGYGFQDCDNLTSITLPDALETIGMGAFSSCERLGGIVIPKNVSSVGSQAFLYCTNLSFVRFVTTKLSELNSTFERCYALTTVAIPEGVETLNGTFQYCINLEKVNLPSTIRTIENLCYSYQKKITELEIPEGVETLADMAIGHMNGSNNTDYFLTSVTLPGSLLQCDYAAFNNRAGLKTLILNAGTEPLTITGNSAYYPWLATPTTLTGMVPLTDLVLRRNIQNESGEDYSTKAFGSKTTLERVTFGGNLTKTPDLTNCKSIESVTLETSTPPVCGGFAPEVYENAEITIPEDAYEAYAAADGWKDFKKLTPPVKATIVLEGVEEGEAITVTNMGTVIIAPKNSLTGEKIPTRQYTATFGDESIATFYANIDGIVAHSAGTTTMTLSYGDLEPATFNIVVEGVDPDNKPDDEFRDGVFWLNEEWFTHTSGSINYIDAEGNIYYRAYGNQNDNMAFGATSPFAMEYAGKLFVMSKQAWDGGDTRPNRSGGRVVVADAKTLQHIAAFDEIGGDGRACVGVSPEKVYLSHSKGVRVMRLGDEITLDKADVEGIVISRSGQVGDMVKAGKYVFAANIGTGVEVIDAETDQYVKTIELKGIQALARSLDGRVWMGCAKTLTPVDPATLEVGETLNIGAGTIGCSSGSWRAGNLKASNKTNTLFWSTGNWNGSNGDMVRWDIDSNPDPSSLTLTYKHDKSVTPGEGYGTPGYDSRTDTWMYATLAGFGAAATQNWIHFINASTGEVKKTMKLQEYFWFPAMPVMPDKHDPELTGIDDEILIKSTDPLEFTIGVTDADNLDCDAIWELLDADMPEAAYAEEDNDEELPIKAVLDGDKLTLSASKTGDRTLHFRLESNGKVVNKEVSVKSNISTSAIGNVEAETEAGEAVYYRIDGTVVNGVPSEKGVYIMRKGAKTQKVTI